ncbi:MAG: SRPBCC domain-containing protein [Rhodospirillaceae bacterium]|mgnify:CR=1 FL=1|nr:SRPBCC domain-containing protein [Rhodospirillaceae bacterium]MBT6116512.1 SRPBCC domain-containing protein [Rhodospirillaceae bacterium]
MPAAPSLTIERRIAAKPEAVFRAWTEPKEIMRWFGPEGTEPIVAETDPRIGGRYRIVFRGPDGEEHDVSGIYREFSPPDRLVFTWAWRTTPERESLVTVALAPDGEGTKLTLTHERFADEEARDHHRVGWESSLDILARTYASA